GRCDHPPPIDNGHAPGDLAGTAGPGRQEAKKWRGQETPASRPRLQTLNSVDVMVDSDRGADKGADKPTPFLHDPGSRRPRGTLEFQPLQHALRALSADIIYMSDLPDGLAAAIAAWLPPYHRDADGRALWLVHDLLDLLEGHGDGT